MNSKGVQSICYHERRRLKILSLLQRVNEEKNELQSDIEQINNQIEEITDFIDESVDLPSNVLLTLEQKAEELMDFKQRHEDYIMAELEFKISEYTKEYDDEKKEAMEEKCSCVDNFKLL